jgi:CDP-diacylglycerol pyrophosphatase
MNTDTSLNVSYHDAPMQLLKRFISHNGAGCMGSLATLVLLILSVSVTAQSAQLEGDEKKAKLAVSSCRLSPKPDTLLSLAKCCADNLASNPFCRAHVDDQGEQYVIVKDNDPQKPNSYLIIPVEKITGIEDTKILSQPYSDLWQDAWLWAGKYPGQSASRIGMAINSKSGRTQTQLHIHISCVLPDVSAVLMNANIPSLSPKPVPVDLGPSGSKHTYKVLKVSSLSGDNSPFKIVAALDGAKEHMEVQSIAVIGSLIPNEYYILNTTADTTNPGHAEELLEQDCGLSKGLSHTSGAKSHAVRVGVSQTTGSPPSAPQVFPPGKVAASETPDSR